MAVYGECVLRPPTLRRMVPNCWRHREEDEGAKADIAN